MNIHIHHPSHSAQPNNERHPGERNIRQKVEQELKKSFDNDLMAEHWTETLIAMWEEAMDLGCSPETAREKLDESLRAVITYHRLKLPILQRRTMIQNVLDHMSREIKTEVHRADEALPLPPTEQERKAAAQQKQRDDDPRNVLREKNQEGADYRNQMSHRVNTANHLPSKVQRRI